MIATLTVQLRTVIQLQGIFLILLDVNAEEVLIESLQLRGYLKSVYTKTNESITITDFDLFVKKGSYRRFVHLVIKTLAKVITMLQKMALICYYLFQFL